MLKWLRQSQELDRNWENTKLEYPSWWCMVCMEEYDLEYEWAYLALPCLSIGTHRDQSICWSCADSMYEEAFKKCKKREYGHSAAIIRCPLRCEHCVLVELLDDETLSRTTFEREDNQMDNVDFVVQRRNRIMQTLPQTIKKVNCIVIDL